MKYQHALGLTFIELPNYRETPEEKFKWFQHMWKSLKLHWDRIDGFRIDKFMMLIRLHVNKIFSVIKESKYDLKVIEGLMKGLEEEILLESDV